MNIAPLPLSPASRRPSRRMAIPCLAGLLALALALPARAEGLGLSLHYGEDGGSYENYGLGLRFGSWWARDLGSWKAVLSPELEFNHWRHTGSGFGPSSLNEAGGIGLFRFSRDAGGFQPYGEIGLGLSLLSNDRLGGRELSTHFQFSEHIGLGLEFGERWFAGWRYSHYSNANIKKPNDGIDLQQVLIGMRF